MDGRLTARFPPERASRLVQEANLARRHPPNAAAHVAHEEMSFGIHPDGSPLETFEALPHLDPAARHAWRMTVGPLEQ